MAGPRSLRIQADPDAPATARAALRRACPDLSPEAVQRAMLLVSELVTNAVRHAGAQMVTVRFEAIPAGLRVEVCDEGAGFRGEIPPPDPERTGGWGLYLVDELATRWGVGNGPGTRVWFEIDR